KCTRTPRGVTCTEGSCDVNNQRSCNIELTLSASNDAQSGTVTLEASFQDSKASKDLTLEICGIKDSVCCENNQCEQGLVYRNDKFVKEEICSGSISVSFSKDKVKPKESVTASFSGISCSQDVAIYLAKDSKENCISLNACIASCGIDDFCIKNCWKQHNGCSCITKSTCPCTFEAPEATREYTYYACVDKNNDNDFNDPGETATQRLIVSSAVQITIKTQDKVVIKRGIQTKIGVSIELSEQSSGRINLKCTRTPRGVTCTEGSCDVNNQRSCNIELTLSASNDAQSGTVTLEASFQDSKASKDLTLEICGIKDSVCCENNQCEQGLICKDNKCVECGKENLPCCQNNQCEQGLICDTSIGKCMKSLCGGEGQQCCENNKCNEGLICDIDSKKCKKLILRLEPKERTITLTLPSQEDFLRLVLDANPDPQVAVTTDAELKIEQLPPGFKTRGTNFYSFSCDYYRKSWEIEKSENCRFTVDLEYDPLCSQSGEIIIRARVKTEKYGWIENRTKIIVEIKKRNVVAVRLMSCESSQDSQKILGISINKPLDEKWFEKNSEDNFCVFRNVEVGKYYLCEVKGDLKFVEASIYNARCDMEIIYPDCKVARCEKISSNWANANRVCPSCTKNEDCPKGYKCFQGKCIREEEQIVKVYISNCFHPRDKKPILGIAVNTQLEDKWWEGKQQNVCVYEFKTMEYECKISGTFRHAEVSVKDAKCDVSIVYPDGKKFDCRGITWDKEWGGPKVCPERECGKENLPCCQNNQCEQGLICRNGKCVKEEKYKCREEGNVVKVEKCSGNDCREVYTAEKRFGKKVSKCLKSEGEKISEVLTIYYEIDCTVRENKITCNFFGIDLSSVSKFCILSDVCFNLPKKT
ncbi:MAG: hypothetical protein LM587_04000, partial [Candidatus Aenigmarchaeota archaeon]|nr:hypothetical protein [Candidatus Aenigmarchaeota archaeon]